MSKVIAGCILMGFAALSTSCVYDPPKNVPTVTLNVKADSLSVTLHVCQGGRWAATGAIANSEVRPIEHKTLFVHPINEYSVVLPANQDVKLDFIGFGGPAGFNKELICDNTIQVHTGPGGRYQADMNDISSQFCSVRISHVLNDGSLDPVRGIQRIAKDDCHT
jgi:hypothetical protein